jgi:hypothetical protein
MKYSLCMMLIVGLQAATLAQFSKGAKDSAFSEIRILTQKWYKASMQGDSATLDKLLAPGFTLNGNVSRAAWMERTLHHIKTDSLQNLGIMSLDYHDGTVVSKGSLHWKALYDGSYDLSGDYSFEDIWGKVDGQWKVLARQSDRATAK